MNTKTKIKDVIASFLKEEDGAGLIEYCLIAAVVGVGCIAAMEGLRDQIGQEFTNIGSRIIQQH